MSEEEKINRLLNSIAKGCDGGIADEVKEIINKQQKEIEKLNFENHMLKKWNEQLDKNCISKDKIIEIIEHYNNELEHIKNGEEFENEKPMYYWGKVALENLLEEN